MEIIPKIGFCVIYHPFEENADNALQIADDSINLLNTIKDIELIVADELNKDINSAILVGNQFKEADVKLYINLIISLYLDPQLLESPFEFLQHLQDNNALLLSSPHQAHKSAGFLLGYLILQFHLRGHYLDI